MNYYEINVTTYDDNSLSKTYAVVAANPSEAMRTILDKLEKISGHCEIRIHKIMDGILIKES